MNLAHTGKDNIQLYNMKGVLIFLKVSENDLISVCWKSLQIRFNLIAVYVACQANEQTRLVFLFFYCGLRLSLSITTVDYVWYAYITEELMQHLSCNSGSCKSWL